MKKALIAVCIVLALPWLLAASAFVDVWPQFPGAISSQIKRIDLYDDDGAGVINVDVHYELSTNNAEAIALGASKRVVVVKMEGTRATVVSAIASIIGASLIVDDGGWPESAVALPRPRKP